MRPINSAYQLQTCRRVIYHGPVSGALPFFANLGFVCPARKDPGSFLQEVTTPKGAPAMCVAMDFCLRSPVQVIAQKQTTKFPSG